MNVRGSASSACRASRVDRAAVAAVFVAVLVGVGLYLAAIGPYWNISPDSATYVGNGRSLAAGRGLEYVGPHPPVTSLVFAPVLGLAPDSYLPLNALVTLLFLGALVLAYRLIEPRGGRLHALLVVLLTLGWTRTFDESTHVLSEPVYAFFSFLALALMEPRPGHDQPSRWRQVAAGTGLLLVGLTRTVGLTLTAAVLAFEAAPLVRRRAGGRRPRPILLAMALLAAAAFLAWKAWITRQGVTTWEVQFQPLDSAAPLERLLDNASSALAVGGVLTNAWDPAHDPWELALHAGGLLLFLLGLVSALRRRWSVSGLYLSLYLAVITAHVLVGGYSPFRHLVPVAPLVFHYALVGVRVLHRRATNAFGHRGGRALQAATALAVVVYLTIGVGRIADRLPDEHRSPFGDYPIKWAGNADAQRLALWIRDHAQPDERFASLQPHMWEVVSQREGSDLVVASPEPAEFLEWLEANRARYIMVDRALPFSERIVEPAVAAYPGRFRRRVELPGATLYEVRPVSDRSPTARGSRPAPR